MSIPSRARTVTARSLAAAALIGLPAMAWAVGADASVSAHEHGTVSLAEASPQFASAHGSASLNAHTDYIYTQAAAR